MQIQSTVDTIVGDLISRNLAEKLSFSDTRLSKEYWVLTTPQAFEKKLIVITLLGHPERVGVWSNTLLHQSRIQEASMEPFFREFQRLDVGLLAINPHFFGPDGTGDTYHFQLQQVLEHIPKERQLGLIGFSMGGRVSLEFLEKHPSLIDRLAGLALIDPVLSPELRIEHTRSLLNTSTLLIASQGKGMSPGQTASLMLKIPKITYEGAHGEMPTMSLGKVADFFQQQLLRQKNDK